MTLTYQHRLFQLEDTKLQNRFAETGRHGADGPPPRGNCRKPMAGGQGAGAGGQTQAQRGEAHCPSRQETGQTSQGGFGRGPGGSGRSRGETRPVRYTHRRGQDQEDACCKSYRRAAQAESGPVRRTCFPKTRDTPKAHRQSNKAGIRRQAKGSKRQAIRRCSAGF